MIFCIGAAMKNSSAKKSSNVLVMIVMAHGCHCKECQRQQHEYKRLDETDEQFQPVKYAGQEKRDEKRHNQQHDFTGKDIAEETKKRS